MRFFIALFCCVTLQLQAQKPKKPSSSEIYEQLKGLNFLGTALYFAAHPDDENTAMISYLANDVHARTGYLALTRGDGGQNLIGSEIRELLGVIRTQELLAARRIDGGEQRFTRANDFGYSKNPEETLEFWEQDQVLSDVVWAIRNFKPDVIINRFDHRSPGSTHGHHTTSAMLSVEAFDLVNDPSVFPNQLEYTETWQPQRLFFNTSWWFYGSQEKFNEADKRNLVSVDVGSYYPSYGLSNTEISALSRSQHKSQGFGNTGSRGDQIEYLELLKGNYPQSGNIFEGIDTSWNRVEGGTAIGKILYEVEKNYDFNNPSASLPELLKAYTLIKNLKDVHWRDLKSKQITSIIKACSGLYLEAVTGQQTAIANDTINITFEAINRSDFPIEIESIELLPSGKKISVSQDLAFNSDYKEQVQLNTGDADLTTAYWLTQEGSVGMYKVNDQKLIGLPETPKVFKTVFNLKVGTVQIPFTTDLVYKYNDRVEGEVYEPFEIVPEASVSVKDPVIIFANAKPKTILTDVTAFTANLSGTVSLNVPEGWKTSAPQKITIAQKGETKSIAFTVTPPKNASEGQLEPRFIINGKTYTDKVVRIDYDHIPLQTLTLPSTNKLVRLNIAKKGDYIGYIAGAGDVIPESLRQIGYQVAEVSPEEITAKNLENFDAVVMGVRAYNVVDQLKYKQPILLDYVKKGGTMVVQYNTARGFSFPNLGPYPLHLSSDRVTDEFAEVTVLDPKSEVLNYPNKITNSDFEGWVQERGLYFPDKYDNAYKPVISIHDKDEAANESSLLIAKYGEGHYIYTGLSFFRELPAGVSGAYRLFANMLSVGKNDQKIKQ
ncbi:LmbE family N-acetylglucosaminyl deacetylase [Leeuwenhoekiella aestuarii]|uniref:LmbE family N-acetylglucosaminyl deacetylase n=1 Tax=Leeuwenhoekiella aestuarii TaxID=2249426 RepID=A0A4Q0NN67_9FLAO|nr:PIG-L family deacetylase [Leeuwenhoekiella aestuarii]RXG11282.1 LmbE family N-acetylglucosaminyl deacetylase [Leeuwenhoekiella aestuarii]RXG11820.1 LmbE family N-acetylglucosaminyl deacetylase [Leeuwenhoekiella aestuarii]